MGCNCNQTNNFMAEIRKAYAEKKVVWSTNSGYLVSGAEDLAKTKLENKKIECYFVPEKTPLEITFRVVDSVPKVRKEAKQKPEKAE